MGFRLFPENPGDGGDKLGKLGLEICTGVRKEF